MKNKWWVTKVTRKEKHVLPSFQYDAEVRNTLFFFFQLRDENLTLQLLILDETNTSQHVHGSWCANQWGNTPSKQSNFSEITHLQPILLHGIYSR